MELPIFKMRVNPEDENVGVDLVSLVDEPAMGYTYQTFSDEKQTFSVESEDKRIVSGVLMLAQTPIYRNSEEMGEHYIVFEKETIENIMQKFFKQNHHLQANFNHDQSEVVDDVYFYESFMIDSERGIKAPEGYDLPDGTWFGTMKVEDDTVWNKIKEGTFTGFSVEGIFGYQRFEDESEDEEIQELMSDINELIEELED